MHSIWTGATALVDVLESQPVGRRRTVTLTSALAVYGRARWRSSPTRSRPKWRAVPSSPRDCVSLGHPRRGRLIGHHSDLNKAILSRYHDLTRSWPDSVLDPGSTSTRQGPGGLMEQPEVERARSTMRMPPRPRVRPSTTATRRRRAWLARGSGVVTRVGPRAIAVAQGHAHPASPRPQLHSQAR